MKTSVYIVTYFLFLMQLGLHRMPKKMGSTEITKSNPSTSMCRHSSDTSLCVLRPLMLGKLPRTWNGYAHW